MNNEGEVGRIKSKLASWAAEEAFEKSLPKGAPSWDLRLKAKFAKFVLFKLPKKGEMEKGSVLRSVAIGFGIVVLVIGGSTLGLYIRNLEDDVEYWHHQHDLLKAELNAPQALVQISKMDFEWEDDTRRIKGEVKNFGDVDAQHVSIHVEYYKEGEWVYLVPGDMDWIDYLRAGENKPFEVKVSDYQREQCIYQIELSYETVGQYGREWDSSRAFHAR